MINSSETYIYVYLGADEQHFFLHFINTTQTGVEYLVVCGIFMVELFLSDPMGNIGRTNPALGCSVHFDCKCSYYQGRNKIIRTKYQIRLVQILEYMNI